MDTHSPSWELASGLADAVGEFQLLTPCASTSFLGAASLKFQTHDRPPLQPHLMTNLKNFPLIVPLGLHLGQALKNQDQIKMLALVSSMLCGPELRQKTAWKNESFLSVSMLFGN